MAAFEVHHGRDHRPDPLGGRFDLLVTDMSVAQSHAHTAVTEQAGDNGQGTPFSAA